MVILHDAFLFPSCVAAVMVTVPVLCARMMAEDEKLFCGLPSISALTGSTVATLLFELVQITVAFVKGCAVVSGVSMAVSFLCSSFEARENLWLVLSNRIPFTRLTT